MYIKKEDHNYFMGLVNGLDEKGQQKLMHNLQVRDGEISGVAVLISDFDDRNFVHQAVDPSELITRTMIKNAYDTASDGH